MCKEIYFKELSDTILGLANLESAGQASRLETQGKIDVVVSNSKAIWRQNSLSLGDHSLFLLRPFTDCMDMECNVLYSKLTTSKKYLHYI